MNKNLMLYQIRENGLTIKEFCKKCGVSTSKLQKQMAGIRRVTTDDVVIYAKELGVLEDAKKITALFLE